ncbi:cob(I)yrinic acid a,c-diamide adenosyltransferase [Acetobacter indonesiensis]|uniref:cob(I)yrinic acid a,c-diamide adenosyltransferase n=1 Tax=Acetobacter indonesiensis TaxID=104101 RepID=UPI001F00D9DB|nr:cob(I)yrinic acid a,c-diamide adenosyltransferase [Acetobacter indonesiensis]MCG0994386.1 cob(I)yrinic acid a,c-diamide adenosyltransferase [Acetobacter indonesiensis]
MSIRIDKVVTRGGDEGQTSLGDGQRVSKSSLRIEAMGCLDELNAVVGLVRTQARDGTPVNDHLKQIQNMLFDMGADLCQPMTEKADKARRIESKTLVWLEQQIATLQEKQAPLTSFVLPGGTAAAAWTHLARTQARTTERRMVALAEVESLNPSLLKILNRLSDYFFVLARHFNSDGKEDILWTPS